jgi:coenzyme F420-reducing hydrogenase alpha subunit
MSIETKYDALEKKYSLPSFGEMDKEFEISAIEDKGFLLKRIVDRVMEKINHFSEFLGGILQPDTSSLVNLYECRFMSDEEKKEVQELYKKVMILNRKALRFSLDYDEKEYSSFIKDSFKEWKEIKNSLLKFITVIEKGWEKETNIKEDLVYLG